MGRDYGRSQVHPAQSGSLWPADQAAVHRGPSGLYWVAAPNSSFRFQQCPFCFTAKPGKQRVRSVCPFVMQPLWPGSQTSWGKFWERCPTTRCSWAAAVAPRWGTLACPAVLNTVLPPAGPYPTWQPYPELALTHQSAFACESQPGCAQELSASSAFNSGKHRSILKSRLLSEKHTRKFGFSSVPLSSQHNTLSCVWLEKKERKKGKKSKEPYLKLRVHISPLLT